MTQQSRRAALKASQEAEARAARRKKIIGVVADADVVGAYTKYYAVVYRNQPQHEGAGYTDEQLRTDFPKQAGITGAALTKFQKLYDTRATQSFVTRAAKTNLAALKQMQGEKFGTPGFAVNGRNWDAWQDWYDQNTGQWATRPTAALLLASIQKTA